MGEKKESEEKKESNYVNIFNHDGWDQLAKPTQDKDWFNDTIDLYKKNKELESFSNLIDAAIEKSKIGEDLLLKELGAERSLDKNTRLNWIEVFKYLQDENDKDNLEYWVKILKDISSDTFINSFLSKSNLRKVSDSSAKYSSIDKNKPDSSLTRPSLFIRQIKTAFNGITKNNNYKGGRIYFNPYTTDKTGKQIISNDEAREVIQEAVKSYEHALDNVLDLIGCKDTQTQQKIKEIARKTIEDVYIDVYKTMYKKVQLRMNLDLNKFIENIVNDKLHSTQSQSNKKELDYKAIIGTYSYHKYLTEYKNEEKGITYEIFLSGNTIDVYEKIKTEKRDTKDFDKMLNNKINKKDSGKFISSLVEFFLSFIVSFEGSAQSSKESPDITDSRIKTHMISLLEENYNQYIAIFQKKYGPNGKNKDNNNVNDAYLINLFGKKGASNRASIIQGTIRELLFSTLLSLRIDRLTKQQYETELQNNGGKTSKKIRAVYINSQAVNKESQQAHDDVVVIIDGTKIGIQVKQYNSKNLATEGVNFYGDKDYNFFGDTALTTKGLGRYIVGVCTKIGIDYKDFIINLRKLSFAVESDAGIDISNEMYPFFLNFARIKDDLESNNLKSEISQLTYNNFYVYNFAMIPTSAILQEIKNNIEKDKNDNKKEKLSGIFTIKPTKVTTDGGLCVDKDNWNIYTCIGNKRITAEGRLNFVGLTVKPSVLYNFEGF